jgi:hypothetical protein
MLDLSEATTGVAHAAKPVHLTLEKLAAITPRPTINLVLYHGVLAPRARGRGRAAGRGPHLPPPPSRRPRPSTLSLPLAGAALTPGAAPSRPPLDHDPASQQDDSGAVEILAVNAPLFLCDSRIRCATP